MARQVTYLSLTSDDSINGCVRTHGAWDTLPTLARLDLLQGWQREIMRLYQAEHNIWIRELRATLTKDDQHG